MEKTALSRPLVRPVVVLVAFYNKKALGVRYLETALEGAGYVVHTIFYKETASTLSLPPPRSWSCCGGRWRRPGRCWWGCR